jgi:hypothetical protein
MKVRSLFLVSGLALSTSAAIRDATCVVVRDPH